MKATILDLRYRMKDVLSAVERGESVTVLHRGKEKATLIPVKSSSGKEAKALTADQPFFGIWRDREEMADPGEYVRKLREDRFTAEPMGARKRSRVKKIK